MLGDLIPVMTGVAMAGRYLGQKIVAMTWIGDGGSSTGVFHEGLNFAAAQKAPFVLILENNLWAYSTPVRRQVPLENLADRAKAYGISSYIVDGNDVVAVYTTAKEAVERARAGEGPILIEAKTFAACGHAQHDPAEYVPEGDARITGKKRDPIALYEKFLMERKALDAKGKKEIEEKIDSAAGQGTGVCGRFADAAAGICRRRAFTARATSATRSAPKWERAVEEVMPPKSSVEAVWTVAGFGRGKSSSRRERADSFWRYAVQTSEKRLRWKADGEAAAREKRETEACSEERPLKKAGGEIRGARERRRSG